MPWWDKIGFLVMFILFSFMLIQAFLMIFQTERYLKSKWNNLSRGGRDVDAVKLFGIAMLIMAGLFTGLFVWLLTEGTFQWRGSPRTYQWRDLGQIFQ